MAEFTRRDALTIGATAIGAAALPRHGFAADDIPEAKVAPLNLPLEKGAELRVLRPAKFVEPDEVLWRANTKKYTDATGIPVRVDFVSWEDIRPQTAVTANTGAGPDIVVGFSADPQIYAPKLVDLSDLAGYLGAKYGGWYRLAEIYGQKWGTKQWLSIPVGGSTGPIVYRKSWLKEAGFDSVPNDLPGFLTLCQKLKAIGHPCGFSLGHALGDGTAEAAHRAGDQRHALRGAHCSSPILFRLSPPPRRMSAPPGRAIRPARPDDALRRPVPSAAEPPRAA